MELEDTEIIYCSSDSDVEIIDDFDIPNNKIEVVKLEDNISINKEEKLALPLNTMLTSELSTNNKDDDDDDDDEDDDDEDDDDEDDDDDDGLWAVEEDSSNDSYIDFSMLSNIVCEKNNENNPKTPETERKILVGNRKLNNSNPVLKMFCSDKTIEDVETVTESYLPTAKKIKLLQTRYKEIDINSDLNINNSKKYKKTLNYEQGSNVPLSSVTNFIETTALLGPSYSKDLSGPSCSKDVPGPSGSSSSLSLNSADKNTFMNKEHKSKLLFNFYNKSFLNGESCTPFSNVQKENIEINQDVKISPLEGCDLVKNVLKSTTLENSNEDSQTIQSEGFVEEPNIVNPDIMYNIDLNEHFTQMDLLVQKIEKTPNDPNLLDECLQLLPIPQIEHEPKVYTIEERTNFLNGISEWEYDIDREDWNKIMVKCAVVFTAHAGFSIANEESLYVLAEVAIDHIKKLAVIMKNNFDIQSKSSYPDKIDPINNSLQEIGVEGGVKELIKHFENDVFSRQNRLVKKCQHYQKIIDQYIENMLIDSPIKNQYGTNNTREDNFTSQKCMKKDENSVLVEKTVEVENTIEEVATDIQQTLEFNIDNLLLTEANSIIDTEMEQTENAYLENSNIEIKKIDIEKKNNENKTKTQTLKIDLLKPIVSEPIDYNPESILNKTQESMIDTRCSKRPNLFSNKSIFNIEGFGQSDIIEPPTESDLYSIKNKKVTELTTLQNLMEGLCKSKSEESNKRTLELQKSLEDFDEDFKQYKASQIKSDFSNSTTLADTNCMTYNNFTFAQGENIVNDGATSSKENETFPSISLLNENDNDISYTQYDSFIDGLLNKL